MLDQPIQISPSRPEVETWTLDSRFTPWMEALDRVEGLALILLCLLLSFTLWTVGISILQAATEPTPSYPPFLTRFTQTLWENRLEQHSSTSCQFPLLLHQGLS